MAMVRISRSSKHILLLSLGITLVTLFLSGNHIYKQETNYIYDNNKAYSANATSLNTSHARRVQAFRQKIAKTHGSDLALQGAINSRSANKTNHNYDIDIYKNSKDRLEEFETKIENKEGPKTVVLLAYMHTGSSYTARIIQHHPGTFYEFEPLRSLRGSYKHDRTIQYLNGVTRRVSGEWIDAEVGVEAVGNMITCNHQKLDVSTLTTAYRSLEAIDSRDIADYFRCLKKDHSKQMAYSSARNNSPIIEKNIQSCLPRLINRCKNASTRLTKYIRMDMKMAEQLLDKVKNLRVIHLLRDPRAMMDSQLRKHDNNVKLFPVFQRITQFMCTRMKSDLDIAERLKKSYLGQIFTLRYEDLVDDPLEIGQQLFRFIDIPFTSADKQFIMSKSIEPVKDSKYRANVWRQHIPSKHLLTVNTYCHDLYKQLGYIRLESISDVRNLKVPDHLLKGTNITGVTN